MTFLVPTLILACVYVGSNKGIKEETKTGFFVATAIIGAVGIVLSII